MGKKVNSQICMEEKVKRKDVNKLVELRLKKGNKVRK